MSLKNLTESLQHVYFARALRFVMSKKQHRAPIFPCNQTSVNLTLAQPPARLPRRTIVRRARRRPRRRSAGPSCASWRR